ncbi:isopentenyl-diphosphate Delta-isomerase [Clostridium sp. C8-1-8]|uniref:isopentenyl-diphosphate Delta-isomerase n=1 Tax=Clostridium sp. C8-1-8 TaxID=2698831 RepID=UPI001371997A|nr:isopentenyl-diphosphate Delta-isomerase [Clostridium sp. C8-1-8]
MEKIAVVNDRDEIVGYEEKMFVHEKGILHRAFSVLIVNSKKEMLLQRRSLIKYHSPGEWTNACCSHQRENESILEAAKRRIFEELGIKRIELKESFVFQYKCHFSNGLWENEIDHVYIGRYEDYMEEFDEEEVEEVKWIEIEALKTWIKDRPEDFTYWFKVLMKEVEQREITFLS